MVLWLTSLFANSGPLDEVETLYYQGFYEETINKIEELIRFDSTLDGETVIELRKYAAFSFVALGKISDARDEFLSILSKDPTVVLDPELVSPKITEVFDDVKREFMRTRQSETMTKVNEAANDYRVNTSDFRTAALLSFAFPGAGQAYMGEKTKSWLFFAGEGLSLGGLIVSQIFMSKAHEDYLEARDLVQIESCYKVYNNWYCARNTFGGLALGIWISAPLEMLIFPPSGQRSRMHSDKE